MSTAADVKFVTSKDGSKIYAEAHGDSSNPAFVLTSGFTLNYICFEKQLALADKLYLVFYDTRGHGRSAMPVTPDAYASELYAADFKAVCDAFGVHRPVFGGWSLGATLLADIIAHLGPRYLSGAISIAGFPHLSLIPRLANPEILSLVPGIQSNDVAEHKEATLQFNSALFYNPESIPFVTKMAWQGVTLLQPPAATGHVLNRKAPSLEVLRDAGDLHMLCVRGVHDRSVLPAALVVELLKEYFSNFEMLEVEEAGHAVFYEQPEKINAAWLDFVLAAHKS